MGFGSARYTGGEQTNTALRFGIGVGYSIDDDKTIRFMARDTKVKYAGLRTYTLGFLHKF